MATDDQCDKVFEVAKKLADNAVEPDAEYALRSAVSRGYYSVHLAARRRCRVVDTRDRGIHAAVISECRRARGFGNMQSDRLKWLLELRVIADYFTELPSDLTQTAPHDFTDWRKNWEYVVTWAPSLRAHLKNWIA